MAEVSARRHALSGPPAAGEPHAGEPTHRPWLALPLAAGVLAVLVVGFLHLPRAGAALPDIARYALTIAIPLWGTTEPVNEIVYGTRMFDTFGETFLLLAAVVSVTSLARSRERRSEYVGESTAGANEQRENASSDPTPTAGQAQARTAEAAESDESDEAAIAEAEKHDEHEQPGESDRTALGSRAPERSESMTVVVRVAARASAVILAVAAIYLCAWGYAPGGGFPAGAALAGVAVLLYAALGYHSVRRVVRPSVLEPIELAGAAAITLIGLMGLFLRGSFGANWIPLAPVATIFSGGIIQPVSVSELVEVGTGLTIAIFALLGMRHDWTDNEDGRGGGR